MCTISWLAQGKELIVMFNRDERVARPTARPPEVQAGPQPFLAPRDSAGGTWIAVRADGTVLALLNNYDHPGCLEHPQSRGAIIWHLAAATDFAATWKEMTDSLTRYPPFHLLTLRYDGISGNTWNGGQLESLRVPLSYGIFTTSSSPGPQVQSLRHAAFANLTNQTRALTGEDLQRFHDGCGHENPASSVWMDRGDRRTVSQSRIRVTSTMARFSYRDCHGHARSPGGWRHSEISIERPASPAS